MEGELERAGWTDTVKLFYFVEVPDALVSNVLGSFFLVVALSRTLPGVHARHDDFDVLARSWWDGGMLRPGCGQPMKRWRS